MSINTTNKDTSKENTNNAKNLFEEHFIPNRKYSRTEKSAPVPVNDYHIQNISSIVMEEISINGYLFIVRYDRCNMHMLTIVNLVDDGYYVSDDEDSGKIILGTFATNVRLENIPIEVENTKKYSRETREIMRYYYRKYHRDILKRI